MVLILMLVEENSHSCMSRTLPKEVWDAMYLISFQVWSSLLH